MQKLYSDEMCNLQVVRGIRKFTPNGVEFEDGGTEGFDTVILATGYRSNVASWLKVDDLQYILLNLHCFECCIGYFLCYCSLFQEEDFISEKDGNSANTFPKGWKGDNGIYSVGFSRQGLLGTSIDARRVAEDIMGQWKSCELRQQLPCRMLTI